MRPARFALALVILLALGAAPEGVARGEPPPYRLVQTDGTVLVLAGPPAERGSLLVGALHPSGSLVSFPKASVDARRTEEANRGAPPPAPPPSPAPRVLADGQTSLGTALKLVKTPEEARRLFERARTGPEGSASAAGAPAPREEPLPEEETEAQDLSGRTEAWWRTHASARRRELDGATARRQRADAELEAAERDDLLPGEAQRRTFVIRVFEARDRAEKARAEENRARARWDALQEDARRSGAPPGWLR